MEPLLSANYFHQVSEARNRAWNFFPHTALLLPSQKGRGGENVTHYTGQVNSAFTENSCNDIIVKLSFVDSFFAYVKVRVEPLSFKEMDRSSQS